MTAQGDPGEGPASGIRRTLAERREALRRAGTREASELLLAGLRDERWSPAAWGRFAALAGLRSVDAAVAHPRALAQVTALHLPFLVAGRGHRLWVATSWVLAATHLGMLGDEDGLGVANTLTLVRANVPAAERLLGPATPVVALATDFADGRIARGPGRVTPFGAAADFVADAAFWTWFSTRHDTSRLALGATLAAWIAPIAALLALSAARGRVVALPRSAWVRPAAVLEVILGVRAIVRWLRPSSTGRPAAPGRRSPRRAARRR